MNMQRKLSKRPIVLALVALIVAGVAFLSQLVSVSANPVAQPVDAAKPAQAQATILVTTTNDVLDAASGVCGNVTLASLPGPNGVTSLREAICAANNNSGVDTIGFNIAGSGVQTINLLSQLPTISGPTTIDGYTQPGASCNTLPNATNAALRIVLVGNNLTTVRGLTVAGGGSIVKGLVLQNFSIAILVQSFGITIAGNFIGTNAAGAAAARNVEGIRITSAYNTVGGGLCDRNLISGNDKGVLVESAAAYSNSIANNLIGTNAAGTGAIPNGTGVHIQSAADNTIGGTLDSMGNLISGNNLGISITSTAGPNSIQKNWIGVDAAHTGQLGNGLGISVTGSSNTLIGGAGSGGGGQALGNVIAYNLAGNVVVDDATGTATGNNIRTNSIYGSPDLGIDLNDDGVTPNDTNDPDGGPNSLQNFPVLTSVTGGTIAGSLNSTNNTQFVIELFASPTCDTSNHGEGQMYLGATTANIGTTNNTTFSFTGSAPPAGWFVSATATDLSNKNTSEFSPCFPEPPTPVAAISGRAYLHSQTPGQEAANALVYACTTGYCSPSATTDAEGDYLLSNLPPGTYDLTAYPPAGYTLLNDRHTDIVANGGTVTERNVVFRDPEEMPDNVDILPNSGDPGGVPVVYWHDELSLSATGCEGGAATYEIRRGGLVLSSGPMTENPAGTYKATVAPLYPEVGDILISISITCPDGSSDLTDFNVYIDPSGVVQSFLPNGTPAALPIATVTLYRSDAFDGPFVVVPDGSAIMSPGNRKNSDITRLGGHFGWDVVPGYYKVRASKANCAKPGDPSQPFVDTYVMTIPPPVTDLVLQLDCGSPSFSDVHTNDSFYNPVTYLAAIGVLGGYGDGAQCPSGAPCFLPSNNVTRGQAAKIIANAAGLTDEIPVTQQTFEDVGPSSNAFWLYIERMAGRGYVGGYPCGAPGEPCMPGNKPYFRSGNNITRNQLTKILVMTNQFATSSPADPHFQDMPATDVFYAYVETAFRKGMIGGYPCGAPGEPCMPGNKPYFRGSANATRGQLSKMVTQTLVAPGP